MKSKTTRILKIIIAFGMVVSVVAVLGARAVIGNAAEGRTYSDASLIPHRQTGLVLGCSEILPNGRKNLFFERRINAAAILYKNQKIDFIIVSGDNHRVGYDEPTGMKNALIRYGVPEDKIFCDYAGFRTLDSVVRAKEIFGQTNITVVSQEFHNQRAIYIARKKNIDAIGFNAEDVGRRHSFRTLVREQFACVKTILDIVFGKHPKFYGERINIMSAGAIMGVTNPASHIKELLTQTERKISKDFRNNKYHLMDGTHAIWSKSPEIKWLSEAVSENWQEVLKNMEDIMGSSENHQIIMFMSLYSLPEKEAFQGMNKMADLCISNVVSRDIFFPSILVYEGYAAPLHRLAYNYKYPAVIALFQKAKVINPEKSEYFDKHLSGEIYGGLRESYLDGFPDLKLSRFYVGHGGDIIQQNLEVKKWKRREWHVEPADS